MADRIKLIVQKRKSLKSQVTIVSNLFDNDKLENEALELRMARLTELHRAFENLNDELMILEPDVDHEEEFAIIQERFYQLAGRVKKHLNNANVSNTDVDAARDENRVNHSTPVTVNKGRRIKLPQAPLPTFDGKFEGWLSFKNAFRNLIDSQSDLSEIDKLHYLKAALKDDAANKIKIFAIDGISYSKAWEVLERAYEVKRVLISRHVSSILNLPSLNKETTDGLTRLADDTQQHMASLDSLGVSFGPEVAVCVLESKLPKTTLEKWEASLERGEFPALDQLYEFLYKTAVCASRQDQSKSSELEKSKGEPPAKKRRVNPPNKVFVLNASRNCVACHNKRHPLYMCDRFKQLSIQKRIEVVKNAKLCYNCLRSHRGSPCKFNTCTICQKRHNTLLHLDKYAATSKTNVESSESKTKTD